MFDFMKQYIAMEAFYSVEVCKSVFNGYSKFKALVLNINCIESK